MGVHIDAKELLKKLVFLLKSQIKFPSTSDGDIPFFY